MCPGLVSGFCPRICLVELDFTVVYLAEQLVFSYMKTDKHLTLIAIVRAVLVPFIERFTSDQNEGGPMPVWLEAGSERARAIYAHYGFRDAGEMDIKGIKTWGMIYTGNIEIGKEMLGTPD